MISDEIACPFFLSVPASAPRTECFCHAVAVASSSMLAPFGWRSRGTSVSSFEVPLASSAAVFGVIRRGLGVDGVLVMVRAFLVSGANRAPLPARARVAGRTTNAHFARTIHRKVEHRLCSLFVPRHSTAILRR